MIKDDEVSFSLDYIREFVIERIWVGIFSSGVDVQVFDVEIPALGIPWFLIVLFVGRTLFDYINLKLIKDKKMIVVCVVLSIIGVILGQLLWLPLSFDIVLAVLPFFVVGKEFDIFDVENKPLKKFLISAVVWSSLFLLSYGKTDNYLILARRRYTLFPICYFIAIAGTLMISEFSVMVCNIKNLATPVCYLGRNSLYMLCIHMMDSVLLRRIWAVTNNYYVNSLCRVVVDIGAFCCLMFAISRIKYRHTI